MVGFFLHFGFFSVSYVFIHTHLLYFIVSCMLIKLENVYLKCDQRPSLEKAYVVFLMATTALLCFVLILKIPFVAVLNVD